jgi:hypothetical protein
LYFSTPTRLYLLAGSDFLPALLETNAKNWEKALLEKGIGIGVEKGIVIGAESMQLS